jgi:hypothetical protein
MLESSGQRSFTTFTFKATDEEEVIGVEVGVGVGVGVTEELNVLNV